MHENRIFFLSLLAQHKQIDLKDVLILQCSSEFNYVVNAQFSRETMDARVIDTIRLLREHNISYTWLIGPLDRPVLLPLYLREVGLRNEEQIGLYMKTKPFNALQLPIKKITSLSEMRYFDAIHGPFYDLLCSVQSLYQEKHCELYVLFDGDSVVTTGIIVFYAGVAGIYYIATVPHAQKKGWATLMTSFLIQKAYREQYEYVVLQATHSVVSLYKKLGFVDCCLFYEFFSSNRCLTDS